MYCYHHLIKDDYSSSWIGTAGIIIALATLFAMFFMWWKDRETDLKIDKKIKKILVEELKTNKKIALALLVFIQDCKSGKKIDEWRYFESKVFHSVINSHRLVRFLSDKSIEAIFNANQTAQSINGLAVQGQARNDFNIIACVPETESWLKELLDNLNFLIPEIEREDIRSYRN